jgi:hypothetical protein
MRSVWYPLDYQIRNELIEPLEIASQQGSVFLTPDDERRYFHFERSQSRREVCRLLIVSGWWTDARGSIVIQTTGQRPGLRPRLDVRPLVRFGEYTGLQTCS